MKTSTAGYVLRSSVIAVMLLCLLAPAREGLCEEAAPSSERYMRAVTRFADTVIEHGRDTYGEKKTPVFVDGLHVETFEPVRWKADNYQSHIMSNFASQQGLMRTLDGLTELTGDTRYRQAAEDATRYTLKNFTSPNGLLFWGGHSAWDLLLDKPFGEEDGRKHELRNHRPYFQIMWRVNKDATRKLMETIWAGHIVDWQRLDYERHCKMMTEYTPKWDAEFREDIDVPYPAWFGNMSFANVTPTLLHTSVSLAILANHDKALTWSRRLAYRWEQAKHPKTGLSGSQLTYRTRDRAQSALNHVHPLINEAKIVFASSARYRTYPLSLMQSAETLIAVGGRSAEIGKEFIDWACDDLKVYARESYQPDKGVFIALMTDGTPIQGEKTRKKRYFTPRSFRPRKPDSSLLWSYAMAYRLTKDPELWKMVRTLCDKLELGDSGTPEGPRKLSKDTPQNSFKALYGLLELFRATGDDEFLKLACRVGDNLLKMQSPSGLFPRKGRDYARTGDQVPLALLHLAAVIDGKQSDLPAPQGDNSYFHCHFNSDFDKPELAKRTTDNRVFYGWN